MEESIEKQKQSIRKQTGSTSTDGFFSVAWSGPSMIAPAPVTPDCPPLSDEDAEPMIASAATEHGLDPDLIRAVIRKESGFRPCAVSAHGAMGLMQLMPATAAQFEVENPFNAMDNIEAGARYLKQLMQRFGGDLKLTLAAYNAGPEKVDGDKPAIPDIAETRDYVAAILKMLAPATPKAPDKAK